MIYKDVLSAIGHTPLVELKRLNPNPAVTIAVKLEAKNPGGSIKDRVALAMIEAAEATGELTPDKIVIEATSGNTGIGLAMVCAVKGYRLKLLMPDSASEERKRIMRAYGAEIALTPGRLGTDGAIEEAYRLAREEPDTYVLMDQFNNPASIEAHYKGTAKEMWEESEGRITHAVIALGTSGTVMGCARKLKELNPAVKVVAVEPYPGHKIQGLKNMQESYPPGIYDKKIPDEIVHVEDAEAYETARRLAAKEGLFAGMSGGAAVAGAIRLASTLSEGLIVAILPDGGERYLSTALFAPAARKGVALVNAAGGRTYLDPAGASQGLFAFGPSLAEPGDPETWRRIVFLDVLRRHIVRKGGKAVVSVGLADMDDRALEAARKAGLGREAFAAQALSRIKDLAARLGVGQDTRFSLASASTETALSMTRTLLSKGLAYEKLRSVYYDVTRDKEYGRLLHTDLTKLSLGKTVDMEAYVKDSPHDFTLLKRVSLQDLKLGDALQTSWGNVRPSWFLQMASAARESLTAISAVFSGEDKGFPHLDNLRAIWANGVGVSPAVWMLGGLAQGRNERGEEGGPCLFRMLESGVHPLTIRLWLLSTAYRKPLALTGEALSMWEKNRLRVQDLAGALTECAHGAASRKEAGEGALEEAFTAALEDDLGLYRFWPALFSRCRDLNAEIAEKNLSPEEAARGLADVMAVDETLGLLDASALPVPQGDWPERTANLVAKREEARARRNYDEADALRAAIAETGYRLEDAPGGIRLFRIREGA